MGVEITGFEEFIGALVKASQGGLERAVEGTAKELTEQIASDARMLCPVDTGDLRERIQTRTYKDENGNIVGEVFNDSDHAPYVEFGTGIVGASAGLKREGIDLTYRTTPWLIPYGAITEAQAEKYHYKPYYDDNGNIKGYLTFGMKPQPFMYPAMKQNEDEIVEKLNTTIHMELKKK